MKLTITFILTLSFTLLFSQEKSLVLVKDSLNGTWRTCGAVDIDDKADTLIFQRSTPNCRDVDCSEHNWSFRETGSVDFIFTTGCNNGFNSVSKSPKRWILIPKDNMLKLITSDGWVEYYEILRLDEKLTLVHRFDLEN
jgi:hypothetical protein